MRFPFRRKTVTADVRQLLRDLGLESFTLNNLPPSKRKTVRAILIRISSER